MDSFLIKFHPQIIDSLFAISIFLLNLVINIVGKRPAIPGIDEIDISDLFLKFIFVKLFNILIFFFLNFFLTFAKILMSVTIKYLGL